MSDLVSILLPAYRANATIERAARSLLAQTYESWELVIASDDGTDYLAVLAEQGVRDARLRQVFTGGVGTGEVPARNTALRAARGAFLAQLDADDAFAPERLSLLMPLAREAGVAADSTLLVEPDGTPLRQGFHGHDAPFAVSAADILTPRLPFPPVFRADLAGPGWREVAFAADVIMNLELMCRAGAYLGHPANLYRYYVTPGSVTNSGATADMAERGYRQILALIDSGTLDLSDDIAAAARAEFEMNLALNELFREALADGRADSLEGFLAMAENGRAPWVVSALRDRAALSGR